VFGMHLMVWPWRNPTWKENSEKVRKCARFGAECVRAAVHIDQESLRHGPLRALFP